MSVALSSLLVHLAASTQVVGDKERSVSGIAIDSRSVSPGDCFVAVRGEHSDGHAFVLQAIERGAVAVVVEAAHRLDVPASTTAVHVPDTRRALSALSAAFYDQPSHALDVIGVTGTNGKTTTTRMIAAILNAAGMPCGIVGTVGAELGERTWELANTTPLPPELHGLLAQMRELGARAVAIEVSSHALELDRVEDVRFAVAALTNITRDHLDFHGTLEAYAAAKHRLFSMAHAAVIDLDDEYGARWLPEIAHRVPTITYGLREGADLVATDVSIGASGSTFTLEGQAFRLEIPGRFNVSNALAAIGVARTLGVDDAASARGLAALSRVPGRMEYVGPGTIDVVVDYAHTPDALEQALRALRETTRRSLIVVFGCGGGRDRGKRAEMGRIAADFADRVYLTSDNPRSEPPHAIIAEIEAGVGARGHIVEEDRRAAIERAVREASPGDVVLIAGKGHETYQEIGSQKLPFDDVAVAREALAKRGARA